MLRSLVLVVATAVLATVALSFEHWTGNLILVGVVGVFHVLVGGLLAARQESRATTQWLALGVVLLGARFCSPLVQPGWDSLGTGRFSLLEAIAPIAAGAFLAFARRYGGASLVPPPPRVLQWVDRWSVSIGTAIGVYYLWNPGFVDQEIFFAPWEVYAVVRGLQYVTRSFRHAGREERRGAVWLLLACSVWVVAPAPLFLQGTGLSGRAALTSASVVVLVGTGVLVFGILGQGTFGSRLALKRTAVVGLLATTVAFLFGMSEAAVSDLLLEEVGSPPGAELWLAAGLVAVLIKPLERLIEPRVMAWLERWGIGIEEEDGPQSLARTT